jgi:hypothetical protein
LVWEDFMGGGAQGMVDVKDGKIPRKVSTGRITFSGV